MPSDSSADRPRADIKTIGDLFEAVRSLDNPVFTLENETEYEAFDRLLAHCRRLYGKGFYNKKLLNWIIGITACFHDMKQYKISRLSLSDFLPLFLKAIGWVEGRTIKQRRGAPTKKETVQRAMSNRSLKRD